uniref:Uncharacterized protein n=1 Tax=Rhizophora mucronata TaxID=61149 RepID=A0A2P2JJT6_RHIMU
MSLQIILVLLLFPTERPEHELKDEESTIWIWLLNMTFPITISVKQFPFFLLKSMLWSFLYDESKWNWSNHFFYSVLHHYRDM